MATVMTTRMNIPEEVGNVYIKEHLLMAVPNTVYDLFAKPLRIDKRSGTNFVKTRRYECLNPATTPLTEGQTPTGSKAVVKTIEKKLQQFGDFIRFTDRVKEESLDDLLLDLSGVLGTQRGETRDLLCQNELMQGTNVVYGGGKTSRTALADGDVATEEMLNKMEETLKMNKAKKITSMISATDRVSTVPVNACFVSFVSVNVAFQIKALPKFVPVEKYSSTTTILEGEIGKHGDIRFIESNNTEAITGGSVDVEQFVVIGRDAYGTIETDAGDNKLIIKNLGENGDDPLDQRGSAGWKEDNAFLRLNEAWIVRGEVAHKD